MGEIAKTGHMGTIDIILAICLSIFIVGPSAALLYLRLLIWHEPIVWIDWAEVAVCYLLIIFGLFCLVHFIRRALVKGKGDKTW